MYDKLAKDIKTKLKPMDIILIISVVLFYLFIHAQVKSNGSKDLPQVELMESPVFKDKVQYVYTSKENKMAVVSLPWANLQSMPPHPSRNTEHLFSKQPFRVCVSNEGGGFENLSEEDLSPDEKQCEDQLGDGFLQKGNWADSSKFCQNTPNQVSCFDSPQKQRFCVFDNSLMDFSKMSTSGVDKKKELTRIFAPGFVQTACQDSSIASSNVGMSQALAISSDLSRETCDVVFNEPVLVYSHSNSFRFPNFLEDSLNIMSILFSLGIAENIRDITLINIDNLAPNGKLNDDKLSSFFALYKFRRVIAASSLQGKKVCFKKLISPTFPSIPFVHRVPRCAEGYASPLLQRWNVMTRHFRNSLNVFKTKSFENFNPNHVMQVTLIYQSKTNQKFSLTKLGSIDALAGGIQKYFKKENPSDMRSLHYGVVVKLLDLDATDFKTQVAIIANTSILVGIDGPNLISGALLPLGTPACCGLLEIYGEKKNLKSYTDFVSKFGVHVRGLDLNSPAAASNENGKKSEKKVDSVDAISGAITQLITAIHTKNSCLDKSVAQNPFSV